MPIKPIPIITIDGPSGSGKGTIALALARRLGWHYLDSGALYRALAFKALEAQLSADDEEPLSALSSNLQLVFKDNRVLLDGADISSFIRNETIGNFASQISRHALVRQALLAKQRSFCELPGLIADGRDMGTIVFPQAAYKFYLTASLEARSLRRYQQLKEQGQNVKLEKLLEELSSRDVRDATRRIAPLRAAPDAIYIDSSHLSKAAVVQTVLEHVPKTYQAT